MTPGQRNLFVVKRAAPPTVQRPSSPLPVQVGQLSGPGGIQDIATVL